MISFLNYRKSDKYFLHLVLKLGEATGAFSLQEKSRIKILQQMLMVAILLVGNSFLWYGIIYDSKVSLKMITYYISNLFNKMFLSLYFCMSLYMSFNNKNNSNGFFEIIENLHTKQKIKVYVMKHVFKIMLFVLTLFFFHNILLCSIKDLNSLNFIGTYCFWSIIFLQIFSLSLIIWELCNFLSARYSRLKMYVKQMFVNKCTIYITIQNTHYENEVREIEMILLHLVSLVEHANFYFGKNVLLLFAGIFFNALATFTVTVDAFINRNMQDCLCSYPQMLVSSVSIKY